MNPVLSRFGTASFPREHLLKLLRGQPAFSRARSSLAYLTDGAVPFALRASLSAVPTRSRRIGLRDFADLGLLLTLCRGSLDSAQHKIRER